MKIKLERTQEQINKIMLQENRGGRSFKSERNKGKRRFTVK